MLKTAHRIYSVLDEIVRRPDRVVLIAAHNGLARIIQSYFTDMSNEDFASFGIGNAEIRRFDF
jgi:probable phosphoglycerate mutase